MSVFTRISLLCLLAFASLTVRGQTASITASPSSGCAPLVVGFSSGASTGAIGYSWDFGDGVHSTLSTPSTSYLTPGSYTVTLTVTYPGGVTVTTTTTITVYPPPTVSFVVSDTSVCPGAPVTFTSTTLGGVPGGITYTWAFGDGTTGTGANPTHTYGAPGYYNITLTATNSMGCVATITMYTLVHIFTPPTPSFTAATTYFCHPPGHAVFSGSAGGAAPFTYSWRFGDGGTGTGSSPTHDYTSTGSYSVTLIVTDANGCVDSITMLNYITVVDPTVGFIPVASACIGSSVTFVDTSSPHSSQTWNFGDGGSSTSDPGVHSYGAAGTYTVTLTVGTAPCTSTATHTIRIYPAPVASFTITPAAPCPPPTLLTFSGTAPAGAIVTWSYGDGATGSGITSSHTYGAPGTYTITMTITDPATGCTSTVTQTKILYDLDIDITSTRREGCAPLTVSFGARAFYTIPLPGGVYPWPLTGYTWTFADGSGPSTSPTPSHTFTAPGTYHVHLTGTTSNGCVDTQDVIVRVGKPPVVSFSATPTEACYHNNAITFNVTVISGPVDSFYWGYGDGSGFVYTSSSSHHYTIPGIFTVTLIASYNGCPDTQVIRTDYIKIDSPKAIFSYNVACSPAGQVTFTDRSLGDDSRLWLFGDGTTDTAKNPVHMYSPLIVYTVTLTTYNPRSGCRDTMIQSVDLTRPVFDFTADRIAVCKYGKITFTPTITSGSLAGYYWSAWSGTYGVHGIPRPDPWDSTYSTFTDSFFTTGIYNVRLIATDQNGCLDTLIKSSYITIAKPVANFTAVPTSGCWPLTVNFADASTDVTGVWFTHWDWIYGDGGSFSTASTTTSHTYYLGGTYTPTMIVTDNIGCKDTLARPVITVWRPTASFTADHLFPCPGDPVNFTNTSSSTAGTFWWFGDGATSTTISPTHVYTASGAYTVKLAVTDSHGCTDTASRDMYINVTKPHAGFYMYPDSVSICPPLLVNFINTSIDGLFYNWSLGDGSYSTFSSPSDLYTRTGYDTIMLIVTNFYGCKDTAYGHVNIFGYAGAFSYNVDSGCAPLTVHFRATTTNVPNIVWDYSDGTTSVLSMTDTSSHVYTIPGAYVPKLILSDNTGCQNSSLGLDTIKVDAVTPAFTTVPNPICVNGIMHFQDKSKGFWVPVNQWLWSYGSGETSTLSAPSYTYTAAGTYPVTLTATDAWGCTATIAQNVIVNPPPVISVCPDTTICLTDAATLTAWGAESYTWSPAATLSCSSCNPTKATPTAVTTYTVTGKDANNCMNSDTVTVFLKIKTVSKAWGDTAICQGLVVPLFDSGGTQYTWVPGTGLNNAHIADPFANPANTTRYMAIAKLAGCVADTNYVTVIVHPLPTVDAGPDQTLVAGSIAQIKAVGSNIAAIDWYEAPTLSCDSCYNPVASMSVTTTYFVRVASEFGCPAGDSVTIHLFCEQSQLFIPNTFTPNGDGQNDVFYPRGSGVSKVKTFRIYNRWGELLFERANIDVNDASNAWDGSYKGDKPRPDVYVWIIEALCETGAPINIKGDVTIIR